MSLVMLRGPSLQGIQKEMVLSFANSVSQGIFDLMLFTMALLTNTAVAVFLWVFFCIGQPNNKITFSSHCGLISVQPYAMGTILYVLIKYTLIFVY